MNKFAIILLTALLTLPLAGCDAGRIQEKSCLRAAAVSGGTVTELTLAFFSEDETVTVEGEDISAALKKAELLKGRSIFTGYTELIVSDGQNSKEILADMLNERKVSPSCRVAYCENGRQLLEEHEAEQLVGTAEQAVRQGIAPECDIITVLGRLCADGAAAAAELYLDGTAGSRIIF